MCRPRQCPRVRRSDSAGAEPEAHRIELRPGTHAIFGYGSLLSVPSLERTLGRVYAGPFVVCDLDGWRRSWDVAMPNDRYFARVGVESVFPREILYLNIRPALGEIVAGVLFVISEQDLAAYDGREWIYERVAVTNALRGVCVNGGEAWAYVGKPEFIRRGVMSWHDAAVRASYLSIVESGLTALGPETRARFELSTDPVPKHLVFADESID